MKRPLFSTDEELDDEDYRVVRPNKSQLRREALAVLELGKKLSKLDESALQKINMPHEVYEALIQAKSIRQNSAAKRHYKHIAKLLRQMDTKELEATISRFKDDIEQANQAFHQIERWRTRLLEQDHQALTDFMDVYPSADSGQIRQLIRNAHKERTQNKSPKAAKQLFRLIRDVTENTEE